MGETKASMARSGSIYIDDAYDADDEDEAAKDTVTGAGPVDDWVSRNNYRQRFGNLLPAGSP